MGLNKWFLMVLFLVQVEIPFGLKMTYIVEKFDINGGSYVLYLQNGKKVWVPITFTIIKEK